VTREDFRREMGDAFEAISGSPNPALSERVRAALVEESPERHGPVWIAALAAAVIAVILVGVLLVGNPLNHLPVLGTHVPTTPSPSPASSPSPNPTPTPTPSASPTASQYICGASQAIIGKPAASFIDFVRTAPHAGYDRLTIEFQNGQPGSIDLFPQNSATFVTTGGRGNGTVKLLGNDGLVVKIFSTDAHTAYSGSTDLRTGYSGLLEVRVIEDYEGYVQWGLGLAKPACYHAFILPNPTRLVIDIQTG
jgi:hypothetical protein